MQFDPKKYWDERLAKNYDLIGVGDISLTMNYNKWSYKVTRSILKKTFKKYIRNGKSEKVIDIGSGTGFVVEILDKMNLDITGVDISPTAIHLLRTKFPLVNFVEFDIGLDRIPIDDNSFGICSAASVLYHIVDDDALEIALKNIHRILEPGGVFIFSDNFIHQRPINARHQKCRTLEEYEEVLRKNGFQILERIPNYVLMNDPVDAQGKFYPRIWGKLTYWSRKSKLFDAIIWPMLYPIELVLTSLMKESPAQEFMICKVIK